MEYLADLVLVFDRQFSQERHNSYSEELSNNITVAFTEAIADNYSPELQSMVGRFLYSVYGIKWSTLCNEFKEYFEKDGFSIFSLDLLNNSYWLSIREYWKIYRGYYALQRSYLS